MVGIIVNPYSKEITQIEIVEVISALNGDRYLVNKREFNGGKIYLNVFDAATHKQTSEIVNCRALKRNLLLVGAA